MYGTKTQRSVALEVRKSNKIGAGPGSPTIYYQRDTDGVILSEIRRSGTNSPPATVVHQPAVTRSVRVLSTERGPRVPLLVDVIRTKTFRNKRGVVVKKTFTEKRRKMVRSYYPIYKYVFRTSKEKYINIPSRAVNYLNYRQVYVTVAYPEFTCRHADGSYQRYSGDTFLPFNLLGTGTAVGVSHEGFFEPSLPDLSSHEQACLRKLHSKISDIPANVAQILAERKQTASLLADAVSRLVSALSAFRRRDLTTMVSSLFPTNQRQLANDFLAFKFGVVPLISDVEGLLQNLSTFDLKNKTVSARVTSDVIDRELYRSTNAGLTYVVREELEFTVKYSATLRFSSELNRAFQRLGLTNLASLSWELVPWSFVADWIFSIGSWLQSLENLAQVELERAWETVLVTRRVFCTVTSSGPSNNSGYYWDGSIQDVWSFKQFSCTRIPSVSIAVEPFALKNNIASLGHLGLSLALLRQKWR